MTSAHTGVLARLTGEPEAFSRAWPREPLVHHGDPAWAWGLLSFAAVDTLVAERGLPAARARMAKDGEFVGIPDTRTGLSLDPLMLLRRLRAGSTLLLSGLQDYWEPLTGLCRTLTGELAHPAAANCYLTPPESQGFGYHWDDHSVFMIQTEGSKVWELYRPIVDEPATPCSLRPAEVAAMRQDGRMAADADLKVELRVGDVLWLPAGWIHNGYATQEWSLHVTVGIHAFTRRRLAEQIVSVIVSRPDLAGRLAPGQAFDDEAVHAVVASTRDVVLDALAGLDVDHLAPVVGAGLRNSLGAPPRRPVAAAICLAGDGPGAVRLADGAVLAESASGGTLYLGNSGIDLPGGAVGEYQRARDGDGILERSRLAGQVGHDVAVEVLSAMLELGAAMPVPPGPGDEAGVSAGPIRSARVNSRLRVPR